MTGPVVIPAELAETLDDLLAELDRRERSTFPRGTELTRNARDALAAARRDAAETPGPLDQYVQGVEDGMTFDRPRPAWEPDVIGAVGAAVEERDALPLAHQAQAEREDVSWTDGLTGYELDLTDETSLHAFVIGAYATSIQATTALPPGPHVLTAYALTRAVVSRVLGRLPADVIARAREHAETHDGE